MFATNKLNLSSATYR